MDARTQAKRHRYAVNAWRLLSRRDARSVRRCKHWLRLYDGREHLLTDIQQRRPQASFQLACDATGTDATRWNEPIQTIDLGDGVMVKDTVSHLREIGAIE